MMFNNPFKGLQLELPENLAICLEEKVRIEITGDYKWGRGWTASEEEEFKQTVYPRLEEAGYEIIRAKDSFSSDYLRAKDRVEIDGKILKGNRLDLYLHPMEFTGFACPKDTEKIMGILKECSNCIYDVKLAYSEKVYDLSDGMYEKILLNNAKAITEVIAQAKAHGYSMYDIGYDFAEECRLPRYGDGAGLSSFDVDVHTIETIKTVAEQTGLLDRNQSQKAQTFNKADVQIDNEVKGKGKDR